MIKKFFSFLLTLVIIVLLLALGLGIFVKVKYDVNVITAIPGVFKVTKEVDESTYKSSFTQEDKLLVKDAINDKLNNFITYSEQDGFGINILPSSSISDEIKLTSKEVGALSDILLDVSDTHTVDISGYSIPFKLIQVEMNNIENGSCTLNTVLKLDITSIKAGMKSFPLNLISNKIPDNIYVSSVVRVNKLTPAYSYSVVSESISINSLSGNETYEMFKLLSIVADFGNIDELNLSFGTTFVNALIGSSSKAGFAYSLQLYGATDYNFEIETETNYFVVKN